MQYNDKGQQRETYFKSILNNLNVSWEIIHDGYLYHPEANS